MTLEILGAGLGTADQIDALAAQPAFRKATRNMALAFAAADAALSTIGSKQLSERSADTGLVLGTCFGELDTTREFLDGFYETGLARPLLFQSSLHNATTGFLAIQLKLTGASFTVTRGDSSGLAALELAATLCATGMSRLCLVLSVEARVAGLEPLFQLASGSTPPMLRSNEGAAALLLGVDGSARELGISSLARLNGEEILVPGLASAEALTKEDLRDAPPVPFPLKHCPVTQLARAVLTTDQNAGVLRPYGDDDPRVLPWRRAE